MSFEQKLLKWIRYAIVAGVVVAGSGLWIIQWYLTHPRTQPIAFSHEVHAGRRSINCFFCHTGALHGDIAGVIAVQDCMQCHQVVAGSNPFYQSEIQKVQGYWNRKQPIEWYKVYKLPKTVQFSHRAHIAFLSKGHPEYLADPGRFICYRCHGNVMKMSKIHAPVSLVTVMTGNMNPNTGMGFCIDCHRANGGPIDCSACHR